jgi:hypothetical protein
MKYVGYTLLALLLLWIALTYRYGKWIHNIAGHWQGTATRTVCGQQVDSNLPLTLILDHVPYFAKPSDSALLSPGAVEGELVPANLASEDFRQVNGMLVENVQRGTIRLALKNDDSFEGHFYSGKYPVPENPSQLPIGLSMGGRIAFLTSTGNLLSGYKLQLKIEGTNASCENQGDLGDILTVEMKIK